MECEKEIYVYKSSEEELVVKHAKNSMTFPLKDLTVLDEVRKVFHETTGLAISFYYPTDGLFDFYPQNEKNPYCKVIQSTAEGLACCLKNRLLKRFLYA